MMIGLRRVGSFSPFVQHGRIIQVGGDGMVKVPCAELQNAAGIVVVVQRGDSAEG